MNLLILICLLLLQGCKDDDEMNQECNECENGQVDMTFDNAPAYIDYWPGTAGDSSNARYTLYISKGTNNSDGNESYINVSICNIDSDMRLAFAGDSVRLSVTGRLNFPLCTGQFSVFSGPPFYLEDYTILSD